MRTVGYLGPLAPPTPQQLRLAVRRLATLYPQHRMLRRLDHQKVRWTTVPADEMNAHCDRMVLDLTGTTAASPEAVVHGLYTSPATDLPVQFAVGPDFCALLVEHACLDGLSIVSIWSEILRCALADEQPSAIAIASIRAPLVRALDNYYRPAPKRILATLKAPHSTPPVQDPNVATVDWVPEFAVVSARGERESLEELRKWRLIHSRGVTRAMVLFAAARASLEQAGLVPSSPGMYVIADIRKFLPKGAHLDGNFASSVYVAPVDPTDPAALNGAVDEALSAARPLATMALVAATASRRRRTASGTPTAIPAEPRPVPSLIHTGRLKAFEKLPWTGEVSQRRFVIGSTPGGPEGISVFVSEIQGGVDVTATFHASTFDRESVLRAVQMLVSDPAGVLDARQLGTATQLKD